MMVTEQRSRTSVRPLARRYQATGEPYVRPAYVQAEIETVLDGPLDRAFDAASSGQLHPQTMVHLLRNYRPAARRPSHDGLVVAFYSRLEKAGEGLMRDLPPVQKEWVRGRVVAKVTEWLARDSDLLDGFEVGFRKSAERLYLSYIPAARRQARSEVSWEDMVETGSDLSGQDVAEGVLARRAGQTVPAAEVRVLLREVWALLNEKQRRALVLVEALGLGEDEAGRLLGCTGRNVRYLIASARAKARGEPPRPRRTARRGEKS